jgi:hypothetical protein
MMKNRVLRALVILAVVAAQAGAGYRIWVLEQQAAAERSAADTFERQSRHLALGLTDLRAALQAYVADGQNPAPWLKTAADLRQSLAAQAGSLRDLARTPDAQGALESAVESVAALGKTDARARDYLESAQRLTASDVVFGEAAPQIARAVDATDVARGHESVASATTLERLRVQQLYVLGAAAAVTLIALLVLLPLPRRPDTAAAEAAPESEQPGSSLGISHIPTAHATESNRDGSAHEQPADASAKGSRPVASLAGTADICLALARVQEPRELPAVLEQASALLNAVGIVVWMPEGVFGALKPALAHGYSPLTVTRMGSIPTDADNATAVAYKTRVTQAVPADAQGNGAVAAPLVTADGCSGVMAAELKAGSHVESARAAATIIAAQLATLISPTTPAPKGHE